MNTNDVLPLRRSYLRAAISIHFGEYMAMMITTYLVFHRTHSVAISGLVLVCFNAPAVVLSPFAPYLTRRFGPLRVDGWLNVAEALAALVPAALGFSHHLSTGVLFAWVVTYGTLEGLNAPNSFLIRQMLAPDDLLEEMNGAYTRNVAWSAVVGMVVGGLLYQRFGAGAIFLLCTVTAIPEIQLFFRMDNRFRQPSLPPVQGSLRAALSLVRTDEGLAVASRIAVLCFFIAGYAVTLPAIASTISSNAEILALLESGSLLGGVFVVVAVRRLHGRVSWVKVQRWCFIIAGLGLATLALAEHAHHGGASFTAVTAVAATLPTGFAILMNASLVTSIMQRATPSDHREPMFTLLAVIPLIVGPVAQVVVGQLSDRTSIPISLAVMSVLTVTLSFLVSHRDLRPHLQLLDEHEVAPHVNAMGGQRSAHRSHHHFTAWVTPSTDVP